jgi:hypothetical protein
MRKLLADDGPRYHVRGDVLENGFGRRFLAVEPREAVAPPGELDLADQRLATALKRGSHRAVQAPQRAERGALRRVDVGQGEGAVGIEVRHHQHRSGWACRSPALVQSEEEGKPFDRLRANGVRRVGRTYR